MNLRGSRRRQPARPVHPDPVTEAELRRIDSLYAAVRRREVRADQNTGEVRILRRKFRRDASSNSADSWLRQASALDAENERLESEISSLHQEASAAIAALDVNDRAFLAPGAETADEHQ